MTNNYKNAQTYQILFDHADYMTTERALPHIGHKVSTICATPSQRTKPPPARLSIRTWSDHQARTSTGVKGESPPKRQRVPAEIRSRREMPRGGSARWDETRCFKANGIIAPPDLKHAPHRCNGFSNVCRAQTVSFTPRH